jgi:hypothetical protein
LLIALSVALFLFWDGPLWLAKREASHVGRFVVSYLAVIPAAALLLSFSRRLTTSHLIAATGSAWGIKLVITSGLYFALARGTALIPTAAQPPSSAQRAAQVTAEYRPAKGDFARGTLAGSVVRGQAPMAGAVVMIDKPLPGLPLPDAEGAVRISIEGSRYGQAVYLGRADQPLEIASRDSALHTFHLYEGDRAVLNVPVPASDKPRPLAALEPGIYEARCDTHKAERAAVVVVDHPYAAATDQEGKFSLSNVPVGPVTLVIVSRASDKDGTTVVRRVPARVEAVETTVVHVDLSTPEVAEERL